jgi:YD repeat-containing protein
MLLRVLFVAADSLPPEDRVNVTGEGKVPLTTKSRFNRHGEVIERIYPGRNITEWGYDEDHKDSRNRGNLLQSIRRPAPGVESDQSQIITRYTYEPNFQRRHTITDPRGHVMKFEYDDRGNLIQKVYPDVTVQEVQTDKHGKHPTRTVHLTRKFKYNKAGQIIQKIDARGAVTEYYYYPERDPTGTEARIVRDAANKERRLMSKPAQLLVELGYDIYGDLSVY